MPIPLGVLAVAGAGGGAAAANAYEWLETTVLGSDTASVTFSNLGTNYGSVYKHLQIRWVSGRAGSSDVGNVFLTLNADTTNANYYNHALQGNGTSVISFAGANRRFTTIGGNTDEFSAGITDILDAFNSNKNTTVRTLSGRKNGESFIELHSMLWNNTASLTSIEIDGDGFNLPADSRFSLYGLRSA